jgi:hypothetical protein
MNEDKVEYVFDQHRSQPTQVISMTQERYDQAIAEARAAEREQCCKDICADCRIGYHRIVKGYDYFHLLPGGIEAECNANAIRQRATKGH